MLRCKNCGREFALQFPGQKYCSASCATEARDWGYRKGTITKTCEVCGKTFEARSNHTKYCSEACRKEVRNARQRKMRAEDRQKYRAINRAYYLRRKDHPEPIIHEKTCVVCGKTFTTNRSNKKCCSPECTKVKDNQARRKRRNAAKMGSTSKGTYSQCRKAHDNCSWCEYKECIYA